MTHNHPFPQATRFLATVETSSDLRNQQVRHSTAAAAKRVVHTTIIDAGWDLEPDAHAEPREQPINARAPRTSLIDSQWDPQPDSRVVHRSGARRIGTLPPRTSFIEATQDSVAAAPSAVTQLVPPWVRVRPRQLALVDTEQEIDPIITWVELDGPECLGLLDGELD